MRINLVTPFAEKDAVKALGARWDAAKQHLETSEDFDNGLSELIDLWSSTASQELKDAALANFKEDLEGAVLNWTENRAKSKKYAAIVKELAEFEEALK